MVTNSGKDGGKPGRVRALLNRLRAYLRGAPPISDQDVERARQDLREATPEELAAARAAARRAIDATRPDEPQLPSTDRD